MRMTFPEFAEEVESARLEVLPEFPPGVRERLAAIHVRAMSMDASIVNDEWRVRGQDREGELIGDPWGEFYPPNGPIVLWQWAYEAMPEEHLYRHQIREVLRHEFRHSLGDDNGEGPFAPVERSDTPAGWVGRDPIRVLAGDVLITLPAVL